MSGTHFLDDHGLWGRIRRVLARFGTSLPSLHSKPLSPIVSSAIVVYALILREATTRYGRRSAGYVWAVLVPTLQMMLLITLFTYLGRQAAAGDSLVVFFLTAIVPILAWRNATVRGASAMKANRALMTYPQVRPFEIVVARTVLELATSAVVVLIIVFLARVFAGLTLDHWVDRPLPLLGALGTLALFCHGSAVLSGQIGRLFIFWPDVARGLGRLLWFTSGIWFTFSSIPQGPRQLAQYNPLAHIVEWLRDAVITDYSSDLYNPLFPLTVGLALLAVGLFIEWLLHISGFLDSR